MTNANLRDRFGAAYAWQLERAEALEPVEAAMARGEPIGVFQDAGRRDWWQALGGWPHSFERLAEWPHESRWRALLVISDRVTPQPPRGLEAATVVFRPPTLTLGVGCRRGITAAELEETLTSLFVRHQLCLSSLTAVASIATRKQEPGLIDFAEDRRIPFLAYAPEKLLLLKPAERTAGASPPGAAQSRRLLLPHACEPAAMLAAGVKQLVVRKEVFRRLTLAVARRPTG